MSDVFHESVHCAVCGEEVTQFLTPHRGEPSGAAPPDFDTRPAPPEREEISVWVSECPRCGFCAGDISQAPPGVREIVGSAEYREQLDNVVLPAPARRFLCYALILEKLHQWADAGWSCLHAAWACDDDRSAEAAAACRALAIERWKRGKEVGQPFAADLASEFALVTDLYRRIGAFEEATVACAEGLDLEDVPPAIEAMLRRQMVLIRRQDAAAHSMAELQRGAGTPDSGSPPV